MRLERNADNFVREFWACDFFGGGGGGLKRWRNKAEINAETNSLEKFTEKLKPQIRCAEPRDQTMDSAFS